MNIKRGDTILVDFNPAMGSEQGKIRPAVVVQNNIGNQYSSTTIVVPITSRIREKAYPTDVFIKAEDTGLQRDGTINCSQIATVSIEHRVIKKIGAIKPSTMRKVDEALKTSLALE
ncbi:MAG: type II toxin-antitoxin system PemK/MazF family toxin [archaeon]